MYSFNLVTTLTQSQQAAGDELAAQVLGTNVHAQRRQGFILSRIALQKALEELGIIRPLSLITLEHYDQVTGLPNLTISLSHSPVAGAALVAERKNFQAVGIDIENEERPVKDAIIRRIAHPLDANLRNIELWCAKEAAFKAIMNTGQFPTPIAFSSIQIVEDRWFHAPSKLAGEWNLQKIGSIILTLAFLKNQDTSLLERDQ